MGAILIPDWATERRKWWNGNCASAAFAIERVLAAMLEIPREEFVPLESRVLTYRDEPVPIGYGQTISQPYMTALMAEVLELSGTETVLEVGAGCGYAAAVLGTLAARVIAVEIVPRLAHRRGENLRRTGRDGNVTVVCRRRLGGLSGSARPTTRSRWRPARRKSRARCSIN